MTIKSIFNSTDVQARYIIALMGSTALALQYCLNVCMSVAIVAMVKSPVHADLMLLNETSDDVCPQGEVDLNVIEEAGDFEWTEEVQGFILSSYYYGYISTQALGGRFAERFGSKYVIGPGIFLSGIFTLLVPWCSYIHVYCLMAVRVLQGVVGGGVIPAMHSLFSKWFPPEERAQFSGIIFSAIYIGTVIAMSLSGVLAHAGGWTLIFYFFGIVAVLWFFLWVFLAYESPEQHPRISEDEKTYIMSKLGTSLNQSKETMPVPWCKILSSPPVWACILMNFGITWENYTLMTELPTYSKNILRHNIRESGLISALPYLFDWMSSIAAGFISRWLRSKGWMSQLMIYKVFNGIVALGGGVCLFAITLVGCDTTMVTILLIFTLTTHGLFIAGSAINHMDLALNYSGTIVGISFTVSNLAGILAPSVVGFIISGQQTFSQWQIVFCIAIAILITTYIFYLLFGSAEEQSWNKPKQKDLGIYDNPINVLSYE